MQVPELRAVEVTIWFIGGIESWRRRRVPHTSDEELGPTLICFKMEWGVVEQYCYIW